MSKNKMTDHTQINYTILKQILRHCSRPAGIANDSRWHMNVRKGIQHCYDTETNN